MLFDQYIGIDYSGAQTPTSRTKALQVYLTSGQDKPVRVKTPAAPDGKHWNWTRKEIGEWLIEQAQSGERFIAGIDHCFSFPLAYFKRYELLDWDAFLFDFVQHWPTYKDNMFIDFIRDEGVDRTGEPNEFRLTERWTSSAKSVFLFDVQGSVAKSSHAGIPWLHRIRQKVGDRVHFWPFDGWELPDDKSVITEVYPSIFRNRYPRDNRSTDEQDAYAVARWLSEVDRDGYLDRYCDPPLTDQQRRVANLEGWILGVG